ncbi:MAG: nucleoside hydrolase [Nitrospirae bacterium]|nr:nucleoside hydrolase [Nitrospirota bacterium]
MIRRPADARSEAPSRAVPMQGSSGQARRWRDRLTASFLCAAIGILALTCCQENAPDDRRLVVMDSDPTIDLTPISEVDDGFDIAVLTRREDVRLLGLTIVFGNGTLNDEVRVAKEVLSVAGHAKVPVYAGADRASRLGEETEASRFLVAVVKEHPGAITLFAQGSLTNIATAMMADPDFAGNLGRLIIVSGAVDVAGNVPLRFRAEANVGFDPQAAEYVLRNAQRAVLVPLDITMDTVVTRADFERLESSGTLLAEFLTERASSWLSIMEAVAGGFYPYGSIGILCELDPSLLTKSSTRFIRIVTDPGSEDWGRTVVLQESDGRSPVTVWEDLDTERFKQLFMDLLSRP